MGSSVLLEEIVFLSPDIEHETDVEEVEEVDIEEVEEDEKIHAAVTEYSDDAIKLYLRDIQKTKLFQPPPTRKSLQQRSPPINLSFALNW